MIRSLPFRLALVMSRSFFSRFSFPALASPAIVFPLQYPVPDGLTNPFIEMRGHIKNSVAYSYKDGYHRHKIHINSFNKPPLFICGLKSPLTMLILTTACAS